MRVLLDAHVSSRHVGRPLRRAGHDVLALDEDETLAQLRDEHVLELAAEQGRVTVTHDVRHFSSIARRWAQGRRSHHGLILATVSNAEHGAILRGIEGVFAAHPAQADWADRIAFLGRG